MKRILPALLLTFTSFLSLRVSAQSVPADFTVPVWATVQETPPNITIHWTADSRSQHFYISRRVLGDDQWKLVKTLLGSETSYTDNAVTAGTAYEYRILDSTKTDSVYATFGFLSSGVNVQYPFSPGAVVLLIDKTYLSPLANEINSL